MSSVLVEMFACTQTVCHTKVGRQLTGWLVAGPDPHCPLVKSLLRYKTRIPITADLKSEHLVSGLSSLESLSLFRIFWMWNGMPDAVVLLKSKKVKGVCLEVWGRFEVCIPKSLSKTFKRSLNCIASKIKSRCSGGRCK